jgi:hypothetical protein
VKKKNGEGVNERDGVMRWKTMKGRGNLRK